MKAEWSARCRLVVICLCVVLLIFTSGCAPTHIRLSPEEARGKFGTIDVKAGQEPAATAFTRPITSPGEGAGKGAAMGALGALEIASKGAGAGPVGLLIGIAMLPLFVVGGTIAGAVAVKDPGEIAQAERVLDRALIEVRIQETLRDSVTRRLMARGLDVRDPASDTPIATVVELQVSKVEFQGSGVDPSFTLFVWGHVTVHGTAKRFYVWSVDRKKFLEWSANDAQLFRENLVRSLEKMAEIMVDRLLSRAPSR